MEITNQNRPIAHNIFETERCDTKAIFGSLHGQWQNAKLLFRTKSTMYLVPFNVGSKFEGFSDVDISDLEN